MPVVSMTLKDGKVIEYETDFVFEDKYLVKFSCTRDGFVEGPWMWIHPDDIDDYKNNSQDPVPRLGVAANKCLNGIEWGFVFPYIFSGTERPICNMDKLIDLEEDPVVSSMLIKSMEEKE